MANKSSKTKINQSDSQVNGAAASRVGQPPLATASEPEKPTESEAWTDKDPRFWQVASVLMMMGIALRQWRLAEFPYHHDEAIHAWFTLGFRDYHYDPVYHGPVLYHLLAGVFTLFGLGDLARGANDYTARLVPSLLGIALLALVLGPARRWLGARGALWSLALLVISPCIVAYHRRLIHDALVMALTLGSVLCFQAARENPSWTRAGRRARVGLVALLTLFVATKANAFFIIAMLVSFWFATKLPGWWRVWVGAARNQDSPVPGDNLAPLLSLRAWLPLCLLVAVGFYSHYALRDPNAIVLARENKQLVISEHTFTLICAAAVSLMWLWLLAARHVPAMPPSEVSPEDGRARGFDFVTLVHAGGVAVLLFSFLFGMWWRLPASFIVKAHPPTFSWAWSMSEITSAVPRMIGYWSGQQKAPRLPGPHDYYIVLMALYELPIAVAALCGIVRASRQRSPFTDLLMWWAFTSFALYAIANEKVPWLLTHIMLPLILLAGWWLAQLKWRSQAGRVAFGVAAVAGVLFLGRGVSATNFERAADHHEPLLYAQSTETFRDDLYRELERTSKRSGGIWVHSERQWPPAWYLREGAPGLYGSPVLYGTSGGSDALRLLLVPPEVWAKQKSFFKGWKVSESEFAMWPRASWPALRPTVFSKWWLNRMATVDNGVLAAPGEWSSAIAVIAAPP